MRRAQDGAVRERVRGGGGSYSRVGWTGRGLGCGAATDLKTSPNLSLTTIVCPSRVKATSVGFFGSSLWSGEVSTLTAEGAVRKRTSHSVVQGCRLPSRP